MKSVIFMLALAFSINGHASVGLSKEFKNLVNDYQYAVTVEWDQQDKDFFNLKSTEFSEALDNLFESGLSSQDIKEAFPQMTSNLPLTLTRDSFSDWVKENKKNFFSQGASWDGTAVLVYGGIAALFIGFISYSVWYSNNYECESWIPNGPRNTCSNWVRK